MELIIIIVIALLILKMLSSLGKALPIVIVYGLIFWLSFYIWDIICWVLAILVTLGLVKSMWEKAWNNTQ
jgi:hypothetical protein